MTARSIQKTLLILALIILASNWAVPTVHATTWCVNLGGTNGCFGTITDAITAASNGDTIMIAGAASPYFEHLTINKSLSLIGENATNTIIDGSLNGQVIRITTAVTVTLTNLTIRNGLTGQGNVTDQAGGGIYNVLGTLTLNNTIVSGNRTGPGSSTFLGGYGGGIYNQSGTLTLNHSTVRGNATGTPADNNSPGGPGGSGGNGGGIFNWSATLTLNDSTISDNTTGNGSHGGSAGGNGGSGGGIYNQAGTLTVNRSTISGNVTGLAGTGVGFNGISGSGAGIFIFGGDGLHSVVTQINTSTLSGNLTGGGLLSSSGGDGGGIYNTQFSTLNISGTTIAFNQMDFDQTGGGIANQGGTVTVKNTLLAYNHGPSGLLALQDCSGTLTSLGYNLMMEPDCTIVATTGDQFFVRGAILGPLLNNGGSTQTHALLPGSPAIDAADNSTCPSTDQRAFPRPIFGGTALRCDVGAFEFYPFSTFLPFTLR